MPKKTPRPPSNRATGPKITCSMGSEEYLAWVMAFKAANEYRKANLCRGPGGIVRNTD